MDPTPEPPADATRLGVILAASVSLGISLMVCLRVLCTICAKRSRRLRLPFLSVYCATPPESPRGEVDYLDNRDQPAADTSVV